MQSGNMPLWVRLIVALSIRRPRMPSLAQHLAWQEAGLPSQRLPAGKQ
jgi:hypothetical protein